MTFPIAEPEFMLIVDAKQKRPAGMFVQLAYLQPEQMQHALLILDLFDERTIVQRVTNDMEVMRGTMAQWRMLAERAKREV